MLARGGRMSLLGLPDGPVTLDLNDQVIFKEARLQGITGREMFRTWQQTTTLLSTGRVDVAPVITHRFPLERVRGGVRDDGVRTFGQGHHPSRGVTHGMRSIYLRDELAELGEQGLLLHPRTLEGAHGGPRAVRRARRHQPGLEQLPGAREPSAAERGGVEGGARARRGKRRGPDDRRAR